MSPLFFWFFVALMLGFAVAVVANRNPVASALCLVVSFLGLAALFVGLDAYFIGVIQILVYAGAVMVLFLFIIMLLDLRAEKLRKFNVLAVGGGVLVTVGFVAALAAVVGATPGADQAFPALGARVDDVRGVGMMLFGKYNLPLQVIGVLVLAATVGVVVLSKREMK